MKYSFPLHLRFKLIALAPQVYITDANGQEILYVRQKILNLREDVRIFSDSSKSLEVFRIKADRIIDFSARYHFTDSQLEEPLGSIKHKGMRSIWNATYLVSDENEQQTHQITEDNPWVKVLDMLASQIPFLDFFSGYIFHPSYTVTRAADNAPVLRLSKKAAFFESQFDIELLDANLAEDEEKLLLLSLMMIVQMERSRG